MISESFKLKKKDINKILKSFAVQEGKDGGYPVESVSRRAETWGCAN